MSNKILNYFLIGALVGGISGAIFGGIIPIIAGAVAGGILLAAYRSMSTAQPITPIIDNQNQNSDSQHSEKVGLDLREERLDITKERVQTADVSVHREVIEEVKTVQVPVRREELVIEKHEWTKNNPFPQNVTKTIRIPIVEERIEISTRPVKLEEVSVYKESFTETKEINETLKKERVSVDVTGEAEVVGENRTPL